MVQSGRPSRIPFAVGNDEPEDIVKNSAGQAFTNIDGAAYRSSPKAQIQAHHVHNSCDAFTDIPGWLNQQRIAQVDVERGRKNAARAKSQRFARRAKGLESLGKIANRVVAGAHDD